MFQNMNAAEYLIYLLTYRKDEFTIGMNEKELLYRLSLTDKNAKFKLLNLLEELNANLSIMGLNVKFNPANDHWFISFKDKLPILSKDYSDYGLSHSLAATLLCILILSISKGGSIPLKEVSSIRKKKNIHDDIESLEKSGYILNKKGNLTLTPRIFYYIDVESIIEEMKHLSKTPLN